MNKKALQSIIAAILMLLLTPAAHAWTEKDTLWETAYLATHITDWGQTRDIARHCSSSGAYFETNPVLGTCPSVETVNNYFIGTAMVHAAVAHMLPAKYRRMFQMGTIGIQMNFISNNSRIGLEVNF